MRILDSTKMIKTALSLLAILLILSLLVAHFPAAMVRAYSGYPTFSILSVVKDTSVTIQTNNLPPNQTFTVRMGLIGTKAIGGTVVGTTDSGAGGTLKLTYTIPDALKGKAQIAIRMDSPAGYFAYNWFDNVTQGSATGTVVPTKAPGTTTPTKTPGTTTPTKTATLIGTAYKGIPTFSIVSVVADTSVTIKTNNFPAGKTFVVRMGAFGTKGIGGVEVGTTESGSGGSFEKTYNIPASLKGAARIAIRMDSTTGGYFSYNWFYNSAQAVTSTPAKTTTAGTTTTPVKTPIPGYSGIPTFSIKTVVKDSSVTIIAKNFPPNQTFTVRMGEYGTKAVGGTTVGTKESGAGGSFEATYTIPDGLKGDAKIAIRMDSPAGFFAYNWFYNSTYP